MQVLILGGSGLIGSAITAALAAAGHRAVGLARSEAAAARIRACGGIPVDGDVTRPESWLPHLDEADVIIQASADFAADPAAAEEALIATLLAKRAALGSRRVIYTGGCWLYPERTSPALSERDAFDPLPAFAYMVRNRERLLASGLDTVTVHPGIVWREDRGFAVDHVQSILGGETITVVGSLSTRWPLVHADDLAQLYRLALEKAAGGTDYLVVTDPGLTVDAIIRHAETVAQSRAAIAITPVIEAVARDGDWIAGQARSQKVITSKARDELGWQPRIPFPVIPPARGVADY